MKTITYTINAYPYNELNEAAKEKVKEWYLNDSIRSDIFTEDIEIDLHYEFPLSELKINYSLCYCQGDGFNIEGNLNLFDFVDHWEVTEKEKRTILFYLENSISDYKFETNRRYSYSCKFIDKKYIDETILKFMYCLKDIQIRTIKHDIIAKFFYDMINYFAELDKQYENFGYEYFYEIDENELSEVCEANDYYFDEYGNLI